MHQTPYFYRSPRCFFAAADDLQLQLSPLRSFIFGDAARDLLVSNETTATMADFSHFGGSEEENSEIKRLNAEVVSFASERGRL